MKEFFTSEKIFSVKTLSCLLFTIFAFSTSPVAAQTVVVSASQDVGRVYTNLQYEVQNNKKRLPLDSLDWGSVWVHNNIPFDMTFESDYNYNYDDIYTDIFTGHVSPSCNNMSALRMPHKGIVLNTQESHRLCVSLPKGYRFTRYQLKIRPITQEEWNTYFTKEEREKYRKEASGSDYVEIHEVFEGPYGYLRYYLGEDAFGFEGSNIFHASYYDEYGLRNEYCDLENQSMWREDLTGQEMTNKLYFTVNYSDSYNCPFVVIEEAIFDFTIEPFEITLDYDKYRNQGFASVFDTDKFNLGTVHVKKDRQGRVHYGYTPYKTEIAYGEKKKLTNHTYHASGLFYGYHSYRASELLKENGDLMIYDSHKDGNNFNSYQYYLNYGGYGLEPWIINTTTQTYWSSLYEDKIQPYGNMSSLVPGHYFAEAPFWASDEGTEDPLNTEYSYDERRFWEEKDSRYSTIPMGYRITGATITVAVENAMNGFYLKCTNNGVEYYLTCYPAIHIVQKEEQGSYYDVKKDTYACTFLLETDISELNTIKTVWRMDNEGHIFTVTDDNKVMFLTNTTIDSEYNLIGVIHYYKYEDGSIHIVEHYYGSQDQKPEEGEYVLATEWKDDTGTIDTYSFNEDSTLITTTYNNKDYYLSCNFDNKSYQNARELDIPNARLRAYDATTTTQLPCKAVHDTFRDVYGFDYPIDIRVFDEDGNILQNYEGGDSIRTVYKEYKSPRWLVESGEWVDDHEQPYASPPAYKMINYIDSIESAPMYKPLMTYTGVQMDIFTRFEKDYTKEYSSEKERLQFPLISLTKTKDMDATTVNDPYKQARWKQTNGVIQLSIGHGKGAPDENIINGSTVYTLDSLYYLNSDAIHFTLRETNLEDRYNSYESDHQRNLKYYYTSENEFEIAHLPYADVKVSLRIEPLNPYIDSVKISKNSSSDYGKKKSVQGSFLNTKPGAFASHDVSQRYEYYDTYVYHKLCAWEKGSYDSMFPKKRPIGYSMASNYSWNSSDLTQNLNPSYNEEYGIGLSGSYGLGGMVKGLYDLNFLSNLTEMADTLYEDSVAYMEMLVPSDINNMYEEFRPVVLNDIQDIYQYHEDFNFCDTVTYILTDRPMYYLRANAYTKHASYVPYSSIIKNYYTPEVKFMRIYDSTFHDGAVDKNPYYGATVNAIDADDDGYSELTVTQISELLDSVITKRDSTGYLTGLPVDMKHILYVNTDSVQKVFTGTVEWNGITYNDGTTAELRKKLAPNALLYLAPLYLSGDDYTLLCDTNVVEITRNVYPDGHWNDSYTANSVGSIRFIDKQPAFVPISFTKGSSTDYYGNTKTMEYVRNFTTPKNGRATVGTLLLPFSVPLGTDNQYDGKLKFYALKTTDCVNLADPAKGDGTDYYDNDAMFTPLSSTEANIPYLVVPTVASTVDNETFSIKIEDKVDVTGWQDFGSWPRNICTNYPLDEYPNTIGTLAATVEGNTATGTVNGNSVNFTSKGTYSGGVFDRNSNMFYFGNNKMLSSQNIKEDLQTLKMYPFRVYYEYTVNNSSGAKLGNMNIVFDENSLPTDITLDENPQQQGGLLITTDKGKINVEALSDMPLSIHDLSGRLVFTDQMQLGESQTIPVRPGVYVVNNQKIIVK